MSYDQADITAFNNAEGVSKLPSRGGWKTGHGRCVFSATGGSSIAAHGMGLTVPKGSSVTRCVYKVLTTFTSASDAGTIALSLEAANDVVSAAAISTGTTWDASIPIVCIPVTATLSTWLHTTVDREFTATVAVEALTAGKLVLFAEWMYWGDLALT
jgi:hypothetical protein